MRIDCLNMTDRKEEETGTGKHIYLMCYHRAVQIIKKALTSGSGFYLGLVFFLSHRLQFCLHYSMTDYQGICSQSLESTVT